MNGMDNIRVLFVAGVRPQYIKLAAVQWSLEKFNAKSPRKINPVYLDTAQHYDKSLSNEVIADLGIKIDKRLYHPTNEPIEMLGSMITGMYNYIKNSQKLDLVVVNGDATSALVGAIAGTRSQLPVAHIEAGMRSYDLREPEEANRRMIDHISSLHLCNSKVALKNLAQEGITKTALWIGDITHEFITAYSTTLPDSLHSYQPGEYILISIHRPVNLNSDETLQNLISTLSNWKKKSVFLLHPRTRNRLQELNLLNVSNIEFIEAIPYSKMISAMKGCAYIVTDSGGTHREAYHLKKRCLVRRDSGGWLGLIDNGIHRRIGTSRQEILAGLEWAEDKLLKGPYEYLVDDDLIRKDATEFTFNQFIEFVDQKKQS